MLRRLVGHNGLTSGAGGTIDYYDFNVRRVSKVPEEI